MQNNNTSAHNLMMDAKREDTTLTQPFVLGVMYDSHQATSTVLKYYLVVDSKCYAVQGEGSLGNAIKKLYLLFWAFNIQYSV